MNCNDQGGNTAATDLFTKRSSDARPLFTFNVKPRADALRASRLRQLVGPALKRPAITAHEPGQRNYLRARLLDPLASRAADAIKRTAQVSRAVLLMGSAFSLACCASKPQIASDYDRSVNFSTYHTFALMRREQRGVPESLLTMRAERDITQELQRRGYTVASDPASADFAIDFRIVARDRIAITSYPAAYGRPSVWGGNIDVHPYSEGTLTIDVFDGRTHRPVWHGGAQKELSRTDFGQPAEPMSQAVSSVLAAFPPSRESVVDTKTSRGACEYACSANLRD